MPGIAEKIAMVRERIEVAAKASGRGAGDILLVGASKMNPAGAVREAVLAGLSIVGENRVQEMLSKLNEGAYDGCELHFIGVLQRNKVNKVVGSVALIQSVGSIELLRDIDARARTLGICQDVLLEVNIAAEDSKSGFSEGDIMRAVSDASGLTSVRVRGLMTIPPVFSQYGGGFFFEKMYKLFVDISHEKYDNVGMDFLSMGMSADFEEAIRAGSNMVRVGTAIFGGRM